MPLDTEALDHFALGVTEGLGGGGGGRSQAELDQHGKAFAAAVAAVRAVQVLADARQSPERRRRALGTCLRDLFDALARGGGIVATVELLAERGRSGGETEDGWDSTPGELRGRREVRGRRTEARDDPAGDAELIAELCELAARGGGRGSRIEVGAVAERLAVRGRLAGELGWFLAAGILTEQRLSALARPLGGRAARRLADAAGAKRAAALGEARLFTPNPTAVRALASGAPAPPFAAGGAGSASLSRVDAAVASAARTSATAWAFRALRSSRNRLRRSRWIDAVRQFGENTGSLVALVPDVVTGSAGGWGPMRRLRRLAERQARLVPSLAGLRDDYQRRAEAHTEAETRWRGVFREQVAAIAARDEWDDLELVYLSEEYPQLALDVRPVSPPAAGGSWQRGAAEAEEEEVEEEEEEEAEEEPAAGELGEAAIATADELAAAELVGLAVEELTEAEPPAEEELEEPAAEEELEELEEEESPGELDGLAPAEVPEAEELEEPEEEAEAVPAPPPPPDNRVGRLPRAATPPPDPGYGSAVAPPPGLHAAPPGPPREPLGERVRVALAAAGPALRVAGGILAAAGGLGAGYALAVIGSPSAPTSVLSSLVATIPAPRSPATNHISVHALEISTPGGRRFGPVDETNPIRSVTCRYGEVTVAARTVAGRPYEARMTASTTELLLDGRVAASGPPVPTFHDGMVEGTSALGADRSRPALTVTVHAACPSTASPEVTMVDTIPASTPVTPPQGASPGGWWPGWGGYLAAGVLLVSGAGLIVARGGAPGPGGVAALVVLGIGGAALGFTVHRDQRARTAADGAALGLPAAACSGCPGGIRFTSVAVERRPSGPLFVIGGSWPATPAAIPADIRLVANDVEIVLRPHQDPGGFQLVAASRGGAPLPADQVAAGLRPGALMVSVGSGALSPPATFEVGLWRDGRYLGRLPATGELAWTGGGTPALAAAASTPAPRPVADLTGQVGRCAALTGGRLPDELRPESQVTGTAPDLQSGAPTHYAAVYFNAAGFAGGLRGHSPFSIVEVVQRSPRVGSGPRAIDRVGDIQLWVVWDGARIHSGVRTFEGDGWRLRQDDPAAGLGGEFRKQGVVFFWSDGRSDDHHAFVVSNSSGCGSLGLDEHGTPTLGP